MKYSRYAHWAFFLRLLVLAPVVRAQDDGASLPWTLEDVPLQDWILGADDVDLSGRLVRVTPCRLVDTVSNVGGGVQTGGSTRAFNLDGGACGLPVAQAYSLKIVSVAPGPVGWLEASAAGSQLPARSMREAPGGGQQSWVGLMPAREGKIDVTASDNTHLVIDVNGYLPAPAGGAVHAAAVDDVFSEASAAVTNPSNNMKLSIVQRCWMPSFGDGDHMSTNKRECPAGTAEGQMAYVPFASESATKCVWRLYNQSGLDHMDSPTQGEGGYRTEFMLGCPFLNNAPGTCEIRRWYRSAINDHMAAFCGESPAGYTRELSLGFGYKRFGKLAESLIEVKGNSVTLKLNLVAGGIITELWWNGKQYLNAWDFGRELQTAISLEGNSGSSETDNPTEGGSLYGPGGAGLAADGSWLQGSILSSWSISGKTVNTTTFPLQWNPAGFGGDQDHPVLWRGMMGKTCTMDSGSNNAIRCVNQIYFPMAQSYVRTEVLTAYLTADFSRFYLYDAARDTLTDITSSCPAEGPGRNGYTKLPGPRNGGIIIATANGAYALGGYHRDPGYDAWYQVGNFTNRSGSGKYGDATTKWSIFGQYPSSSVSAGTTKTYTNYLTVGTLATARSEMRRLYLAGN